MQRDRTHLLTGARTGIAILGALIVLLGACGTAVTPAPATTATAAPSESPAPGLLGQLRARGVIRVSNTQANPPWNFLDDRNQLAGCDVDIANEVAKRLKIGKVEFIGSNFANFIPGVQTDKFDIVIAGQTVTDERKLQVDSSKPYQVNGVSIFVNTTNTTINNKDDLAGKRIGGCPQLRGI